MRKDASDALAKTFKANLRTFTLITNTLAKDKEISDRWRGFEDVADSRHLANRVEREVVEALVAAVREAYPRLSHRYYALKAQVVRQGQARSLGPQRAAAEGRAAHDPLERGAGTRCSSAYSAFSPRMADIARRFFDESWIDAPTRPGKAPGAFAHPTVPSAHPYVLLNYQGKPRDVMTLAHELGHGVHQVLAGAQRRADGADAADARRDRERLRRDADLPPPARRRPRDPVQRKAMLAAKVEDMINTVVRQIAFYSFERKVHLERRNGELTADKLCELWMSVQDESLGPAIRLGEGYETFWTYIPHFIHSPFYVYAYAFGDCLVNSLYGVYETLERGLRRALFRAALGRRHQALLRAARALRPRRQRPGLLADRPVDDRAADRRAGGDGVRNGVNALPRAAADLPLGAYRPNHMTIAVRGPIRSRPWQFVSGVRLRIG